MGGGGSNRLARVLRFVSSGGNGLAVGGNRSGSCHPHRPRNQLLAGSGNSLPPLAAQHSRCRWVGQQPRPPETRPLSAAGLDMSLDRWHHSMLIAAGW